MIAQKKDANQDEIIAAFQAIGYSVLSMDRLAGFDILAIKYNRVRIIEIKNPKRHWHLTPAEIKMKAFVENAGGRYEIILYPHEVTE